MANRDGPGTRTEWAWAVKIKVKSPANLVTHQAPFNGVVCFSLATIIVIVCFLWRTDVQTDGKTCTYSQRQRGSFTVLKWRTIIIFTGPATEIKADVGKTKSYKVPEYFKYNAYSFYDLEKDMVKDRVPQPKSGLSEFWWMLTFIIHCFVLDKM